MLNSSCMLGDGMRIWFDTFGIKGVFFCNMQHTKHTHIVLYKTFWSSVSFSFPACVLYHCYSIHLKITNPVTSSSSLSSVISYCHRNPAVWSLSGPAVSQSGSSTSLILWHSSSSSPSTYTFWTPPPRSKSSAHRSFY